MFIIILIYWWYLYTLLFWMYRIFKKESFFYLELKLKTRHKMDHEILLFVIASLFFSLPIFAFKEMIITLSCRKWNYFDSSKTALQNNIISIINHKKIYNLNSQLIYLYLSFHVSPLFWFLMLSYSQPKL